MCRNFRLKHFCISCDTYKQNSVTRRKAIFASGLSFALPLVCRLRQNVTVGRIISNWSAEKVLNPSFILLCHWRYTLFPTALRLFWFWLSDVEVMPFVCDNILKIFESMQPASLAYKHRVISSASLCICPLHSGFFNSRSLTFRWPLNARSAWCRQKLNLNLNPESALIAVRLLSAETMSADSAHFSAFGAYIETEFQSTCSESTLVMCVMYFRLTFAVH